jgi:hypothetical protein
MHLVDKFNLRRERQAPVSLGTLEQGPCEVQPLHTGMYHGSKSSSKESLEVSILGDCTIEKNQELLENEINRLLNTVVRKTA